MAQEKPADGMALMLLLREMYGFPLCMQKLLHDQILLEPETKLEVPMDVQLVLEPPPFTHIPLAAAELLLAASEGNARVTRFLLETNVGKRVLNVPGDHTTIHQASERGDVETARLLLLRGAHRKPGDRLDRTALHRAAEQGHVELVRLLLEFGANRYARDGRGETALHRAADRGHVETVRLLLESSADMDAQDFVGTTALHRASGNGHLAIVRLLLDAGVSRKVQDGNGHTALKWASRQHHVAVVRLLVKACLD